MLVIFPFQIHFFATNKINNAVQIEVKRKKLNTIWTKASYFPNNKEKNEAEQIITKCSRTKSFLYNQTA